MFSRSSRNSWLLITIFLFLLHFFFPLFFRRVKGKRISMVVVKNHAFLLDPPTVHPKLRNNLVLMVLNICIPLLSAHSWYYLWVSWSSSIRFHYVHRDIWFRKTLDEYFKCDYLSLFRQNLMNIQSWFFFLPKRLNSWGFLEIGRACVGKECQY